MRFHLTYSGPLSGSGNSSKKPQEVSDIREALNPQLATLWRTHPAMAVLAHQGWLSSTGHDAGEITINGRRLTPGEMGARGINNLVDLTEFIVVEDCRYKPLVRKSLDLTCSLKILFLRQEDPGSLVLQGGDIDNRLKTLLDALKMPTPDEVRRTKPRGIDYYCLMESDTLVSALSVDTDRLLAPATAKANEVHLVIEVALNVLKVGPHNACLL